MGKDLWASTTTMPDGLILETGALGDALRSPDKLHRYRLRRPLAEVGPTVLVVMQNPSKAGADENDPTITRVIGFGRRLGAGRLIVVNMGAGVATDPADFLKMDDPIGPMNYRILQECILGVDIAIAAWGDLSPRLRKLFRLSLGIIKEFKGMKCLGKTKSGDPRHPLYLSQNTELSDWP